MPKLTLDEQIERALKKLAEKPGKHIVVKAPPKGGKAKGPRKTSRRGARLTWKSHTYFGGMKGHVASGRMGSYHIRSSSIGRGLLVEFRPVGRESLTLASAAPSLAVAKGVAQEHHARAMRAMRARRRSLSPKR